jgi:NAD+ synthase (glutamine-hydrolysing)
MKLMQLFGVTSLNIDIQEVIEKHLERIGQPQGLHDITYEQAQSRERTQILMDLSNKENGIVIGTGDLSELALGWMSYCGDQMSMYAINSGLPKSMLRNVIKYYAEGCDEELKTVLFDIMDTPISPELLPVNEAGMQMQKTEELVGPYIVHDFFLYYVIWYGFSIHKILKLAEIAFDGIYNRNQLIAWMKIFIHRFFTRQFKRTCFPDGLQLWNVSLSPRGFWRMPSDVEIATWSNELDQLTQSR